MTRDCSRRLGGAQKSSPCDFPDEFPEGFLNALEDARLSINHSGLNEICGLWVGEYPECKRQHRGSVIDHLVADGLLDRVGRAPTRTVTITETGLMTLDLLGEGQ